MESLGAKLKKIRLEKGLSLDEVQKKTKIHTDIIKSLEEDSLVGLNPVYIKGFLKIYCGFLGLDPAEFVTGYKENGTALPAKPREKEGELFWGNPAKKPYLKPQVAVIVILAAGLVILSLGLASLFKFVSSKSSLSRKAHTQLVLPRSKPVRKPERSKIRVPATAGTEQNKVETIAIGSSTENPQLGVRIGIHALDDCWVQTRIDGKTVFQSILRKGRFESWSAKEKVELALGSAGGVRLEVNGKIIPSLGRKGQVLKNILITKDGLRVGK